MEDAFLLDRLSGDPLTGHLAQLWRPLLLHQSPLLPLPLLDHCRLLLLVVLGVEARVRPVALGIAE